MKSIFSVLLLLSSSVFAATPPSAPKIVASFAVLNQTRCIPAASLYTPTADQTLRVSMYGSYSGTAFPENMQFSWIDDLGRAQLLGVTLGSGGSQFLSLVYVIRASANKGIVFTSGQCDSADPYSQYVTVEQLQ